MNNQILFERLRDLRERNHYTQAFVSSKLNIGRATYSNYERGKRTPSLDVIMDLAHFYDVSEGRAFAGDDFFHFGFANYVVDFAAGEVVSFC